MGRVTDQLPHVDATATIDTLRGHLQAAGGVVVDEAVSGAEFDALRQQLKALVETGRVGATTFGGLATRRVFDPFARSRCLDQVALHPLVLDLARDRIGACQLGMTVVSDVLPGQSAQQRHRDAGVYPLPLGAGPVMMTAVWAIDEFTAANGATRVAPGSHLHAGRVGDDACLPVEMAPGSVLLIDGRTVHAAGANQTSGPRLGVILEYVASWLRPSENHTLSVPPATVFRLPVELQELLGYNQRVSYHGFVAGQHPRDWLAAQMA
jgi:ectoine hydroxylase-related dioxygenase (phytanoyl-CoA dioxygenase family)